MFLLVNHVIQVIYGYMEATLVSGYLGLMSVHLKPHVKQAKAARQQVQTVLSIGMLGSD